MTKEERADYMKKYRLEHKEEIRAYRSNYYLNVEKRTLKPEKKITQEQKEKNAARVKAWKERNIERQKEYQKRYYAERKNDPEFMEKMRERVRRYREYLRTERKEL